MAPWTDGTYESYPGMRSWPKRGSSRVFGTSIGNYVLTGGLMCGQDRLRGPKMERKYFHARAVGSPEAVLQKITTSVREAGLASEIPLVKLERRARGEFYVFLGVESEAPIGYTWRFGQIRCRIWV